MKPETWHAVERLLEAALALPRVERPGFLEQACAGNAGLRREVESLLEQEGPAERFLEAPASSLLTEAFAQGPEASPRAGSQAGGALEMTGRTVSHYRLLEMLGEGGMGAVYRAIRTDGVYEKHVAIKLVKPDAAAEIILRHFHKERRILSNLEHPNIARLLDGGETSEGLPFFVMELVEGQPIDRFCDSHNLSTTERLKLFQSVCAAVHYAHQRLIIHRDLKPGNVLVTAEGNPKLLDFGIATILTPDSSAAGSEPSRTWHGLMTPEYASPEQLRGEPISTATDVYSLGVLLYRLLTGRLPYRLSSRSPFEVARAACDMEPERPSAAVIRMEESPGESGAAVTLTPQLVSRIRGGAPEKLRRRLAGDIDYILMKALRKEPEQRYASVEQFSEDIRRHLAGLPVMARQGTLTYRGSKFIRRNRVSVAVAVFAVLSLLGGMGVIAREAHIAAMERAKAEQRFNDVRQLANSLVFELHDAIRDLPGSTPARELVLRRALQFLDGLARDSSGNLALQRELSEAYRKIGDVQGRPGDSSLGEPGAALESYRKALELRQTIALARASNWLDQRDLATAYANLAQVLLTGNGDGGDVEERAALRIRDTLAAAQPNNLDLRSDQATSYLEIGIHHGMKRDFNGALESYSKSLQLFQQLAGARSGYPTDQYNLARAHKRIGAILIMQHRLDEARTHYQTAITIDEARCRAMPDNASARLDLTFGYSDLALIFWRTGNFTAALQNYRKVLAIRESLAAADPRNARAQLSLASTYYRIGAILNETGDAAAALEPLDRALAIQQSAGRDQSIPAVRIDIAATYGQLANAWAIRARKQQARRSDGLAPWREAYGYYRQSLNIYAELKASGKLQADDVAGMNSAGQGLREAAAAIAKLAAAP